MTCTGLRDSNPFNLLGPFDSLMPNEMTLAAPQRNSFKKGALLDSTPVAGKLQRNADQRDLQQPCNPAPRPNANNKPRFAEVRASVSSLHLAHAHISVPDTESE